MKIQVWAHQKIWGHTQWVKPIGRGYATTHCQCGRIWLSED